MASKKISELAAASILGGGEKLAGVQAGANVSVTPDQIADRASRLLSRPRRIAFAGDSIGEIFGRMVPQSPWYWSLVQTPRVWDYALDGVSTSGCVAVSGSCTGDLWTGAGRTGTKAHIAGADDLSQGQLTRLLAYKPDILFLETGTNDASAPTAAFDATFLNVRDVYEALVAVGLKHLVVCSILPRANLTPSTLHYNQSIRQWARVTPGVHVLDLGAYMADDASAGGNPLGGTAGAAGAMTFDGLHPSVIFGRAAAPAVTAMLDNLNIPRTLPRGVDQKEIYNAATSPGGNLLGTKGAFLGTGGSFFGGAATGVVADGWLANTDNAELTAAFSKGTMTDARGQSHGAQVITLGTAGGAPLTGNRTFTLFAPLPAFPASRRLTFQALAQFVNLVGCASIRLSVDAAAGVPFSAIFGSFGGISTPSQDFPTSATLENMDLVAPWNALPDVSNTALNLTITGTFRAGAVAAGTISVAQAGVWAEVVLP